MDILTDSVGPKIKGDTHVTCIYSMNTLWHYTRIVRTGRTVIGMYRRIYAFFFTTASHTHTHTHIAPVLTAVATKQAAVRVRKINRFWRRAEPENRSKYVYMYTFYRHENKNSTTNVVITITIIRNGRDILFFFVVFRMVFFPFEVAVAVRRTRLQLGGPPMVTYFKRRVWKKIYVYTPAV